MVSLEPYQYGLLAVLAVFVVLGLLFRKALLPLPVARVYGRFVFVLWKPVLLILYQLGIRKKPWKELRPGVWIGKVVRLVLPLVVLALWLPCSDTDFSTNSVHFQCTFL
jgi:hypothetical protein